jgi:hypothetical protein
MEPNLPSRLVRQSEAEQIFGKSSHKDETAIQQKRQEQKLKSERSTMQ